MPTNFEAKKTKILQQLSAPAQDYTDASPKGSVDEPIRDLVSDINQIESLVTTSSCSGRIAIYLEGQKRSTAELDHDNEGVSAPQTINSQGKGGGRWLFVSHQPVEGLRIESAGDESSYLQHLLKHDHNEVDPPAMNMTIDTTVPFPADAPLLHLKFEPLILHILCADLPAAKKTLAAASAAGFRESGVSSLPSTAGPAHQDEFKEVDGKLYPRRQRKPQRQTDESVMVAIRTMGLGMDAPIGYVGDGGEAALCVSEGYLASLVGLGNQRFKVNGERMQRLREGLHKAFGEEISAP